MTLLTPAPPLAPERAPSRPAPATPALPTHQRRLAAWSRAVLAPMSESRRSRLLARVGGLLATWSLIAYLLWRVLATMPASGPWRWAAWLLVMFEALPLLGSMTKL